MRKKILLILVLATPISCVESTSIECPNGMLCPSDMQCAADGRMLCLDKTCGSGYVDSQSEQCDGDGIGHPGETATCNVNCTKSVCGDGIFNATSGEQCDGDGQGHGGETATCNANCTLAKNGDGWANTKAGEDCDGDNHGHGNGVNCESSTCTAECKWKSTAFCGNGIVDTTEDCDGDGKGHPNTGVVPTCDYNQTCQVCGSDCHWASIKGPYCGDDILNGSEACDNAISVGCKTCGGCQFVTTVPATGNITVTDANAMKTAAQTTTHDTFTLDSGWVKKTFEIASSDNCAKANVCIVIGGVASDPVAIAGLIAGTINGTDGLSISANQTGAIVALTNTNGLQGNRAITSTGNHGFTIAGMSGAIGCSLGWQCWANQDCSSGNCANGVCEAK